MSAEAATLDAREPITPPATDALAAALRRALADERDPAVKEWLSRLLGGDAHAPDSPRG